MKYFELKKEHIEKAATYMPLEDKLKLAKKIAQLCIEDAEMDENDKLFSLPPQQVEDLGTKAVLLQNILLGYYLDIELNETEDVFGQYNFYNGNNIINQIERFKSDSDVKNKVYDLIADYKEFKKMVDIEIYNIKIAKNDTFLRILSGISLLAAQKYAEDPQLFTKIINELDETLEELSNKGKDNA